MQLRPKAKERAMKTKLLAAVVGFAGCMGVSSVFAGAGAQPTVLASSQLDGITAGSSCNQSPQKHRGNSSYKKQSKYQKQDNYQKNESYSIQANVAALNNVAVLNEGDQNFKQSNSQRQSNVSVQYQR